jgi:hypothetical protein
MKLCGFEFLAMNFEHQKIVDTKHSFNGGGTLTKASTSFNSGIIYPSFNNNGASTMRSFDNSYNFDNEKFQQQLQL